MSEKPSTVVRNIEPMDEDEFHGHFMALLGRLIRNHGASKVAQALGYSSKRQLANLTNGSLPSLRGYYNLLALEPTAHDEIDRAFGQQKVPDSAQCTTDPLTLDLITLARDVAQAESDKSHGEQSVTDKELRAMDENLIRKVHRVTGSWLDRLETMHRPRAVRAA